MKKTKKLASLLLALVMALVLAVPAMAQEVSPADASNQGSGSITITNPAMGETYKLYRLFDATVPATGDSIAYTGTVPTDLATYFTADTNGYITATDAAWRDANTKTEMSDGLRSALTQWAKNATPVATAVSDGSELQFTSLKYGYYVVGSTQGTAITVDSTKPEATIVDKNSSEATGLTKTVDDDDVNIGDTVTYTVAFTTSNYTGAGADSKKIISYTITDTLPEFLSNVSVTSIIVDNDGNSATADDRTDVTAQFSEKKIVIDWYDEDNGKFLYNNGATITITYTAVVTDEAAIDGEGNKNKVTVQWTTEGETTPGTEKLEGEEVIYTYAIALKKVDQKGNALSGATFEFPFYVKETKDTDGAYIYAGTTPGTGLTNQITTPDDGVIIVKGVATGTYSIKEVKAPDGYNMLAGPVSITAAKTGKTTTNTTIYLDENGNVTDTETETKVEIINNNVAATAIAVVNKAGAVLPSTGGMGTTIFYVTGSILVLAAVVLLVTKKRMKSAK